MNIFRKPYTLTRYPKQKIVKGYAVKEPGEPVMVKLNVQPLSPDELAALPEGDRRTKRLKAYGDDELIVADQILNTNGDRLTYRGKCYECVSCLPWDHTILAHFKSEFVQVPESENDFEFQEEGDSE